jgi:hypothetical protein
MAKKSAGRKTAKKATRQTENSLKSLSKLSKEELLIKLGQLMTENAALRKRTRAAVKTTDAFRNAAQKYLGQPLQDTMTDYED